MKASRFTVISFAIMFLLITSILTASATAADKVYHWKWYTPFNRSISPFMDQLPKLIEQKTNGRIKVSLNVGGQHPFRGPDMPKAIKTGACQMADVLGAFLVGEKPLLGAGDLPFFADTEEEEEAIRNTLFKELYENLNAEYGMMPVASYNFPGQTLAANLLLKDFNSLKGKKIRVFNKITANMIITLGGNPVTIPATEIYTAMQRGIIDGAIAATFAHVMGRTVEITKYLTRIHYAGRANVWNVMVSKEVFEKLTPDLQAKFLEACSEYQALARKSQDELDAQATVEAIDKYGATVICISPEFRQKIREKMKDGCWEKWAKGVPGGMEFLEKMESFHEKWVRSHG